MAIYVDSRTVEATVAWAREYMGGGGERVKVIPTKKGDFNLELFSGFPGGEIYGITWKVYPIGAGRHKYDAQIHFSFAEVTPGRLTPGQKELTINFQYTRGVDRTDPTRYSKKALYVDWHPDIHEIVREVLPEWSEVPPREWAEFLKRSEAMNRSFVGHPKVDQDVANVKYLDKFAEFKRNPALYSILGQVYEETVRRLFDVPEEETMHEITGWDESKLVENFRPDELLEWVPQLKAAGWTDVTLNPDYAHYGRTKEPAWISFLTQKTVKLPSEKKYPKGVPQKLCVTIELPREGKEGDTRVRWYPYAWGTSDPDQHYPGSHFPTFEKLLERGFKIEAEVWRELWNRAYAIIVPPEPEEMHTITGWDESIVEVLRADRIALGESTVRAYGHGREPIKFTEQQFGAADAWSRGAGLDTMNDLEYHRILVCFASTYYPLKPLAWGEAIPQIVMRWMGNFTSHEGDIAVTLDVPRGRGLKSYFELRDLTDRESTLPEALKTLSGYVGKRSVDKMALRNLPKEEAWPRLCEVYRHLFNLFTTPVEPEEMHEISGWDEAVAPETFDLSDLNFQRAEAAIPEWEQWFRVEAMPNADEILVTWRQEVPGHFDEECDLILEMDFAFSGDSKFFGPRRGILIKTGFSTETGYHSLHSKRYFFPAIPARFPEELSSTARPKWWKYFDVAYRKVLEPLVTPVEPEEMHTIGGWDESRLTESINLSQLTPEDLRNAREEWARRVPWGKDASAVLDKYWDPGEGVHFAYWANAEQDMVYVSIGLTEKDLSWWVGYETDEGNVCGFYFDPVKAPASGAELVTGKMSGGGPPDPERIRKMQEAYDIFISIVGPPPAEEEMHEITGWDEARRPFPTGDATLELRNYQAATEAEARLKGLDYFRATWGGGDGFVWAQKEWRNEPGGLEVILLLHIAEAESRVKKVGPLAKVLRVEIDVMGEPSEKFKATPKVQRLPYYSRAHWQRKKTTFDAKKIPLEWPGVYLLPSSLDPEVRARASALCAEAYAAFIKGVLPSPPPEETMHEITGWDEALMAKW